MAKIIQLSASPPRAYRSFFGESEAVTSVQINDHEKINPNCKQTVGQRSPCGTPKPSAEGWSFLFDFSCSINTQLIATAESFPESEAIGRLSEDNHLA